MSAPLPIPRRVLAVMAHPDDIEFMSGGLVAGWARAGAELHYLLLTDGNSGSRDQNANPEQLATLRRDEQRRAGALLGVKSYTFLGHPDGRLVNTIELRLQIARIIRTVQPDTVLTSDPLFVYSPFYINHPDHRAAGDATAAAIMPLANTRLAALELIDEGLEPHDVEMVYFAAAAKPTHWVAVETQDFEQQVATMRCHESQIGAWDFTTMLRDRAAEAAREARASGVECELAEGYVVINLKREA